MLKTKIEDGKGTGYKAHVTKNHELLVTQSTVPIFPPAGSENPLRYYTALMGTSGADSGTTSMNVNGSVTSQIFYIQADTTADIRVMTILVTIIDGSIAHNKFGAIAALTNGFILKLTESGEDVYLINEAKTGGEMIQQTGITNIFGGNTTANIIQNFSSNYDALFVSIPIFRYIPSGLRIGLGGIDKITAIVQDDLTGLVDMFVRVIGYRHFDI
jgi:hypothetical protein